MTDDKPASAQAPAENFIVADILSAVGVNVGAFIVGYPAALILPGFLILVMPFGVFWVYLALVAWYAVAQFRKGRMRRAVIVVSLAALVLIFFAMNIRVA